MFLLKIQRRCTLNKNHNLRGIFQQIVAVVAACFRATIIAKQLSAVIYTTRSVTSVTFMSREVNSVYVQRSALHYVCTRNVSGPFEKRTPSPRINGRANSRRNKKCSNFFRTVILLLPHAGQTKRQKKNLIFQSLTLTLNLIIIVIITLYLTKDNVN